MGGSGRASAPHLILARDKTKAPEQQSCRPVDPDSNTLARCFRAVFRRSQLQSLVSGLVNNRLRDHVLRCLIEGSRDAQASFAVTSGIHRAWQ